MRRYYSSRNRKRALDIGNLYLKVADLFTYFEKKQYFKEKLEITDHAIPESAKRLASLALQFCPFPIRSWPEGLQTEDSIFDLLEFLFDHISKPGELVPMNTDGYNYYDFLDYDETIGKQEFRDLANSFLRDYREGYEISPDGSVLSSDPELEGILTAEIIPFDKVHVDDKVRLAIVKWRNRDLDLSQRKEAIRELADVFEWLKKSGDLGKVLGKKDESDLFNIANNFHIRHHNPAQASKYDEKIWCSWMIHFYLASYHAVIRLLIRNAKTKD
ncbi:MAG TPA: hypothetical protein PLL77_11470 [Pyrinomonadaceae bacterium]|nr:hypothetical protein [Pyrinomonadaceae bacterium]